MEGYQTEDQILDNMKEIWKQNKWFIISLLIISFGLLFGINMYRTNKIQKAEQASSLYQEMLSAIQESKLDVAKNKGNILMNEYKSTPYSSLSAILLSKISVEEKDLSSATEKLYYIVKNSNKKNPIWHVAKYKLAKILNETKKYQEALKELDNPSNEYIALYEELKGDIYVSLNDLDKAREAYKKAVENSRGTVVPWLGIKLSNIEKVKDVDTHGSEM